MITNVICHLFPLAATGSAIIFKMTVTKPEKAFCVLEFARFESVVNVQRVFCAKYRKDPPVNNSIMKKWYMKLEEDGYLCDGKRSGRRGVSEEKMEQVREVFQYSTRNPREEQARSLTNPSLTSEAVQAPTSRRTPHGILQRNARTYGRRDFRVTNGGHIGHM